MFAFVAPPAMLMNAKRFCGLANAWSNRCAEIVTSPKGEPPLGGAKMPSSRRCSVALDGVFSAIGEPTVRWCDFA